MQMRATKSSSSVSNPRQTVQRGPAQGPAQNSVSSRINSSPVLVEQRRKLQSLFGQAEPSLQQSQVIPADRGAVNPVQRTVAEGALDARYAFWLGKPGNRAAFLQHLKKTVNGLVSVEAYLALDTTTKESAQKEMEKCVAEMAKEASTAAVTKYGEELPSIKKPKFARSNLLPVPEDKLTAIGEHVVANTFRQKLATLPIGTKLYHCTKAADAIMHDELKGGTGIKDSGQAFVIDPSLVGRISLTDDKNRKLSGTTQLEMTLQAGDIEAYGIFKFGATREYVATVPIPGNRFTIA